jgi:hypothetical protein
MTLSSNKEIFMSDQDNWQLVWEDYLTRTNATPAFTTVTLTSGSAHQNTGTTKQKYFIGITGGTAGTVQVDISPDDFTTTHNLIPATAANAVASQTLVIDVPAGWYIKVTVSVATIVASSVVATDL